MGNKPMYRQIADAFREKINAGELNPETRCDGIQPSGGI